MSQSERIRHIQEQANRVVSRNRCVDASLLTMQRQAAACARGPVAPVAVSASVVEGGCCRTVTIKGKGTANDYSAILQKAQGCAICPDVPPADGGSVPVVLLSVPCVNNETVPFAQQNISTIYPAPYVAPCTDPGNRHYFPEKQLRGDGPSCTLEHLPYDS